MIRTYTVDELEQMSGFTRRTISDYISKGILAGPSHRGRGARYPQSDVDILRLVPRIRALMKAEFPTLKAISAFLQQLSAHDVSGLANHYSDKGLVQEVRRIRVRTQLSTLLPMVAPDRLYDVIDELSPAQISGIDTGRYPIGAVLDISELFAENQLATQHHPHTERIPTEHDEPDLTLDGHAGSGSSWSVNWLGGGSSEAVPDHAPQPEDIGSLDDVLHRMEAQLGVDQNGQGNGGGSQTAANAPVRSVDRRIAEIAARVERLERLLETQ